MKECVIMAGGGTGGHVFPLLAVAEQLRQLEPALRIVFVGTARGLESRLVPSRGFELELLDVRPIRGSGLKGVLSGGRSAVTTIPASWKLIRRLEPRAVLSVGGYAAGPISIVGRMLGVPLAVLEPNTVVGLANRWLAPWVGRAYTAFPETDTVFRESVIRRLGVPLREGFSPQRWRGSNTRPRVLVLGGSQGAVALNEAVPQALSQLKTLVSVTHQCGPAHGEAVHARYAALGTTDVEVVPFIDDMPRALSQADLVVGRSGASAVSEICAVGRASVLVPYPFAAGDHQRVNADSLARAGAAVVLPVGVTTPSAIAEIVEGILGDRQRLSTMSDAALELGRPSAARAIALDLLQFAGLHSRPASVPATLASNSEVV